MHIKLGIHNTASQGGQMDPHWINRLVAFQDVGENVPSRIHLNQERPEDSSGLEDLSSNHEKVGTNYHNY